MKVLTGIDIIYLPRFKKLLQKKGFIKRIFTESEYQNTLPQHLAGLFAVKEAFFKATQIKIKKWHQLAVLNKENGKPYIQYDKNLLNLKIESIDISISHDKNYVVGNVIILTKKSKTSV